MTEFDIGFGFGLVTVGIVIGVLVAVMIFGATRR